MIYFNYSKYYFNTFKTYFVFLKYKFYSENFDIFFNDDQQSLANFKFKKWNIFQLNNNLLIVMIFYILLGMSIVFM